MLLLTLAAALAAHSAQEPAPLAASPSSPSEEPSPWGRFRGPGGSGRARDGALPATLDLEQDVLWAAELPSGYSSPIVVAGRVFVTGAADGHVVTLCLDEATGEHLWRRRLAYDGSRPGANSPAASTPATDGARVFALFHHVGLVAYDLLGEELWRSPLGAPFNLPHGLATSPVVHDDCVVLQLDQDTGSALVCLDATTGAERWRTSRPGALHGYSTPAVCAPAEGPAVVVVSGSYEVSAYDLSSGERLWWVGGAAWQSKAVPVFHDGLCIVSSHMPLSGELGLPTISGSFAEALAERDGNEDGLIARNEWPHEMLQQTWFIWDRDGDDRLDEADFAFLLSTQSARGGLFAIRMGGRGDVTDSHVVWTYDGRRGLSDVVSPLVVGDSLYLLKDGGLLTVLDAATGEPLGDGRVGAPDSYYASPVAAGERLLAVGLSGQVSVVAAGGERETLATVELDVGRVWATPALARGRILVRGEERLLCLRRPE